MLQILSNTLPILILIYLGYFLKKKEILSDGFFISAKKFLFYIALPSMIFLFVSTYRFLDLLDIFLPVGIIVLILLFLVLFGVIFAKKMNAVPEKNYSSFFLGSFYNSSMSLGVPVFILLFNENNLAIFFIVLSIMIPLINLIILTFLKRAKFENESERKNILSLNFGRIAFNPIILSCLLGFIFSFFNIKYPSFILNTFSILSETVVALSLIVIGSSLRFGHISEYKKEIIISTIFKLILMPIFAIFVCKFLQIDNATANVIILYLALPSATAGYILASDLGGNSVLLSNVIAVQTLLFSLIIPIIVYISHLLL